MFWAYLIGCCVYGIIDAQISPFDPDGSLFNSQQNPPFNTPGTGPALNPPLQNSFNQQNDVYTQPDPQYNQGNVYNQPGSYFDKGTQYAQYNPSANDVLYDLRCPDYWVRYYQSCYKFVKSPLKPYEEARRICQVSN